MSVVYEWFDFYIICTTRCHILSLHPSLSFFLSIGFALYLLLGVDFKPSLIHFIIHQKKKGFCVCSELHHQNSLILVDSTIYRFIIFLYYVNSSGTHTHTLQANSDTTIARKRSSICYVNTNLSLYRLYRH